MNGRMDRRSWLGRLGGILAAGGLLGRASGSGAQRSLPAAGQEPEYRHYFGDLHNHCEVGYAQGSLERLFEIGAGQLDFLSFTPHSHWPDVPEMEQGKQRKWLEGFEVTRRRWPEVQALNASYHKPGEFVTFPGYEWHSSQFGDFCIVFPSDQSPLTHYDSLRELQEFAFERGALLIPHHPAYLQGHRGANPRYWDSRVTRLLEIYSEHGNAERDEGPLDYIRHSMGGRSTPNTLQTVLAGGHRVGVLASSDDHLGCPGAYGEGLAVVLAPELTRESLFEALRSRRVYGVTGDRIKLDLRVNGQVMGRELPFTVQREIFIDAEGWDTLEMVELVKNNRVLHREFPVDRQPGDSLWSQPVLVRIELGWGPWADLGLARVCDWEMDIAVQGGSLLNFQPCFQSGPLDEQRRNRITRRDGAAIHLVCHTSRRQAFAEKATNAVALKIQGGPESRLSLEIAKPAAQRLSRSLSELMESNAIAFSGPFPDESLLVHRPVPLARAQGSFTIQDESRGEMADWYYARVTQANGQLAWSSPVWVERKA